ncbi:MAG: cation:proton antiporter [Alphaproteobacteria bacterium]|jgi:CPA2 family monovalent cation:H+ antiporter-2
MPHETPLIATISIGLGLAFLLGLIAQRIRLPPIVGYLAAGIIVGPFTPGYVADQKLAVELAEIGVILLMFGVGLHFSLKDLLSVRAIAIPGAIGQIVVATAMGTGLALLMGWSVGAGVVFGLALSVASTVVLLRALQERRQVETEKGRIAVGWLIVEDLIMVVTLVLLPPLAALLGATPAPLNGIQEQAASSQNLWSVLGMTALKISLFVALMLALGRKAIPWALHYVAHTGSRELFRLGVLAIALGVAFGSAKLFGVSFALGAFFAGMVLAESQLSTQAAKETLPLRDAFAVLFFVSVGMLFDPSILLSDPLTVIATFIIIAFGKSLAAYFIVRSAGHPRSVALTISASLAQIGEFSFILIVLAVNLAIVPEQARDLVVAGAIMSIMFNPLMFWYIDRLETQRSAAKAKSQPPVDQMAAGTPGSSTPPLAQPAATPPTEIDQVSPTSKSGHTILIGAGRVGSIISDHLAELQIPFVLVDEDLVKIEAARARGIESFIGPAGERTTLELLNLGSARCLITAIPDAFEAGHLVEAARKANPAIRVIARAHDKQAIDYLKGVGADEVLLGEEELARAMCRVLT